MQAMPDVTIMRAHQYQGGARKMRIELDGEPVGFVKDGRDLDLEIPVGVHTLTAKMDWCRRDLKIDLADGDELFVEVGFLGGGLDMIFRPSEALFLRAIDLPDEEVDTPLS